MRFLRGRSGARLPSIAFLARIGSVVATTLLAAEITARMVDLMRFDTPLLAAPSVRRDLTVTDSLGTRGRPNGRYKAFSLNGQGFRGPELAAAPPPGCVRAMMLGASETFGDEQTSYPEQLRDTLRRHGGCWEVVNAGLAGLNLTDIITLWNRWASRFHPRVVVVYPSPAFYLLDKPPEFKLPRPGGGGAARHTGGIRLEIGSRLVDKLRDRFEVPGWVQRWRIRHWIDQQTEGHDSGWFFREPPPDRLVMFHRHLDSLVTAIQADGAIPVLVTHAMRFGMPPRPEDRDLLTAWRRYAPRATETTLLAFEWAAADEVRRVAAARRAPLVDIAAVMSGHGEWFVDFVHFTPVGAGIMAGLLADTVRSAAGKGADTTR